MISFEEALGHFNTGKVWFGWKNPQSERNYDNLVLVDDTAIMPTEEEVNAKIAELEIQENRAADYPSIPDQLDEIFHNGLDAWKATIQTTKDKYPKE